MFKNFESDYEVCSCNQTTLGEIINAIQNRGANTIEKITSLTDAGSICKCCKSEDDDYTCRKMVFLDEILEHFNG